MTTHELFRQIEDNHRHRLVAVAAYYLWEAAGRPAGRDLEFWLAAERRCRRDCLGLLPEVNQNEPTETPTPPQPKPGWGWGFCWLFGRLGRRGR